MEEGCAGMMLQEQAVPVHAHDEPMVAGRRWYRRTGARYAPTYGMLLELIIAGQSHFTRATVPVFSIQDANAICVDNEKAYDTAEELYDANPVVQFSV